MIKHLAICILLTIPTIALATDGDIEIFHNGQPVCGVAIPCGQSVDLEVYAIFKGTSSGGITGAEYSLAFGPINVGPGGTTEDLTPDGLTITTVYNPAVVIALGSSVNPPDPGSRGLNISFAGCQTGDGIKLLLETLTVTNSGCQGGGTPTEVEVHVIRHDSPFNDFFQCPLFTLCDDPVFTKVCLGDNVIACTNPAPPHPQNSMCSSSGKIIINPEPPSCGITPVQPGTWGILKSIYR